MLKYPLWKPILIVLIVAGCGALIASKGLKPGIDLAGGTTLVYDVLVPAGKNAEEVINDTIAIQRERVDAAGVKNLVWRAEAGDRISVTMALAGPDVQKKRQAFEEARKALLAQTLDPAAVDAALLQSDPALRAQDLARLAGANADLLAKLQEAGRLHDERQALQKPYDQANKLWQEKTQAFGLDPAESQKQELDALLADLNAKALAFSQARRAFSQARSEALAGSVNGPEIDRILALSNEKRRGKATTPRSEALAAFLSAHPESADAVSVVADAWADYEQVKGPLDDPEDLKRMLRGAGVLEFRIAATPGGGVDPARPIDTNTYTQRLAEKGPRAGLDQPWRWFKVQSLEKFVEERATRELLLDNPDAAAQAFLRYGLVARAYGGDFYVLLANEDGLAMTGDLDWELTGTTRSSDSLGRPAVGFSLNPAGAELLAELTGPNVGRQMAIVLDGELMSAPELQAQLSTGGIITGSFSQTEFQYLLNTLGAGSLEGQLSYNPISEQTIAATFGEDNVKKGLRACVTALVVVGVFMALYYLFAGLVADFALCANMVIILGIMSMIEATFTLPGVAGLVLTIGMAVDANVLIFERIREERQGKADLPTAVRLGFDKALSTILDANITTLITCVVLGYTATAEVKGFAVVLGIGILATLFTALFSTRVIVELYMLLFKAKDLPMLPTLIPALSKLLSPKVNWVGLRGLFMPVSLVLIVAGLGMALHRGEDLLDIEFRSGTEVTFNVAEGADLPLEEVRRRLEGFADTERAAQIIADVESQNQAIQQDNASREADQQAEVPTLPDWSLLGEAQVVTVGGGGDAGGYRVATLIENADALSQAIKSIFRDSLDATEPVSFRGNRLSVAQAKGLVEPVTEGSLYASLGRQFAESDPDVKNYVGGVGLVLEELAPAVSLEDVKERITSMRRQPDYEQLGLKDLELFGLQRAGTDAKGNPTYSAVAAVLTDYDTNYAEDRSAFTNPQGLAALGWGLLRDALERDTALDSVSNFSSQVSGTMKQQAIVAMALSLLAVVAYIWLRFGSLRYGLAAICALVHDVCITLGVLAICGYLSGLPGFGALLLDDFKINLALVAALLTIVGYSLNDTIVVFDRIRENRGRLPRATPEIVNNSINQTISRTVLTSGTTLIAVLTLYLLGGPGVHGFAFAMIVGVLVGTYSSVAIAAPIILVGQKSQASKSDAPTGNAPAPTT